MSNKKSTFFFVFLVALTSLVVGMVIASRLDLTPASLAGTLNVPAANSAPLGGPIDATTFRMIAHDQGPAVVSILTKSTRSGRSIADFFGFQDPQGGGANRRRGNQPQTVPVEGAGSGFIIDKAGFILTNNHVVQDATEIEVRLQGTEEFAAGLPAKVVGRDVLTDSALIQLTELPKEPLTEVKFGDSSQMQPGDWVMAIGNPFRFSNSVSVGVVSAVGRTPTELRPAAGRDLEMIQTDAAINPGNSGGPLLNVRGEVIGTNTAIVTDGGARTNIGIGFAVPINTVRDILPQLRQGKVVRGRIGVQVSRIPMTAEDAKELYGLPAVTGAVVDIVEDGPAKAGGMRAGDVVLEFNGRAVKGSSELVALVSKTAPGTSVPVKISRNGKSQMLNVRVEELNLATEQVTAQPAKAEPDQPTDTGTGMHISAVTPQIAKEVNLPKGKGGAVIADIDPGSPAFQAGLAPGDVILSVNNVEVATVDDARKALDRVGARRTVGLMLWRGGREVFVQMRKR